MDDETPATRALSDSGLAHTITRHGRVGSLAEAAAARGVEPSAIVKTMVVRRGEGDHLFVLVPGDRQISLPVVADERMVGQTISLGAGGHGVAATLAADDVIAHLGAQVADVTDPA